MGHDTDFGGLCSRVDELERMVQGVAVGHDLLTQQIAEIVTEQHAAIEHRKREEQRMEQIEQTLAASHLIDQEMLAKLVTIEAQVADSSAVTREIKEAVRWANRTKRALTWLGALVLGVGSIVAGIKMMLGAGGPPPPPPPPAGGPF